MMLVLGLLLSFVFTKMAEQERCINCNLEFNLKNKSYERTGLFSKIKKSDAIPSEVLREEHGVRFTPRKSFLCKNCTAIVQKMSTGKKQVLEAKQAFHQSTSTESYMHKKLHTRTPEKTPRKIKKQRISYTPKKFKTQSPKAKTSETLSRLQKGIQYIKMHKYGSGLRMLYQSSKAFARTLKNVMKTWIRKEMAALVSPLFKIETRSDGTRDQIMKFDWDIFLSDVQSNAPLLYNTVVAAMCTKKGEAKLERGKKQKVSIKPAIGNIFGAICYQRKPTKLKLIQEMNSIQLWLGGCNREVFGRFNHLGMCMGIDATRKVIDRIRDGYDNQVKVWKANVISKELKEATEQEDTQNVEEHIQVDTTDDAQPNDIDMLPPMPSIDDSESDASLADEQDNMMDQSVGIDEFVDPDDTEEDFNGYTLCFDNVNQKTSVRHQGRDRKNIIHNMVQAYAAKDRIPSLHLVDDLPDDQVIRDIPVASYFPSAHDQEKLKDELEIVVARILVTHLPYFQPLSDRIPSHIAHPYLIESKRKSEIVPMGVLNHDEATTEGMIQILDKYHSYIPMKANGGPHKTILFGDGLSCERANDAQNARINSGDPWSRLEGLEPAIQEWHRRLIQMQDTFDDLYSSKSARDKGTLYHLRNMLHKHNLTSNLMDCFNHASDFMKTVTEAYTVLAAMKLLETNNIQQSPSDFPENNDEQEIVLQEISNMIVDMVFMPLNANPIINANTEELLEEDEYEYCSCKTDRPIPMIKCGNRACKGGIWFHFECVGVTDDTVPDKWFCSDVCEAAQKTKQRGRRRQSVISKLIDYKFNYSKALLWRGLNDMARKDAVRENDGERMIMHWKYDILEFHECNHPKYFIYAHRLLTAVNGGASRRLKHQLTWNRTVNLSGGMGTNLEMDLVMEFMNKDYKGSVKHAGGQLTEDTVARHSQMVGIGKELSKKYDIEISTRGNKKRRTGTYDSADDVAFLIEILYGENLWDNIPGRKHEAYPDFDFSLNVTFPRKLKNLILKHKKQQASRRELVADA